jgi:hypothetical protein
MISNWEHIVNTFAAAVDPPGLARGLAWLDAIAGKLEEDFVQAVDEEPEQAGASCAQQIV